MFLHLHLTSIIWCSKWAAFIFRSVHSLNIKLFFIRKPPHHLSYLFVQCLSKWSYQILLGFWFLEWAMFHRVLVHADLGIFQHYLLIHLILIDCSWLILFKGKWNKRKYLATTKYQMHIRQILSWNSPDYNFIHCLFFLLWDAILG